MQDHIQFNRWKREWVWAICYELLRDYPEQLTPPSTPAFSEEWMNYLDGLKENLHKHLKTLSFADVENRWKSMIVESETRDHFILLKRTFIGKYWDPLNQSWNFTFPSSLVTFRKERVRLIMNSSTLPMKKWINCLDGIVSCNEKKTTLYFQQFNQHIVKSLTWIKCLFCEKRSCSIFFTPLFHIIDLVEIRNDLFPL